MHRSSNDAGPSARTRGRGQVIERQRARGRYFAIRFHAYGQRHYLTLGTAEEGWTRARAQVELENVLADVRRGIWQPPAPEPVLAPPAHDPTFHEFSSQWLDAHRRELRANTVSDYEWQLTHHLLPFFARHRLADITVQEVDRYRQVKVREGRLSATSINKTLTRLAQILEVAVEYELIDRNPAKGKRRRLKAARSRRAFLDRAEQIAALLDAAGELDREARADRRGIGRRALLATLVYGGMRVGELCALRWGDVDLAGGRLRVRESKTAAGIRYVDLLPALRDELSAHKANARRIAATDLAFATTTGGKREKDNVRNRVLAPAVRRANLRLRERGLVELPDGLTLHSLRHTCCSLMLAKGDEVPYVMAQLGHSDPAVTLGIYAHVMFREEGERERLRALVQGADWAPAGTSGDSEGSEPGETRAANRKKTPRVRGIREARPAGFEPAASRSGGGRSIH